MEGASAEGWNWISPSAMGMDESSAAKKARLELPNGHVKQEAVVLQEAAGEEGIAAAEYGSRAELAVRFDMRVLHCPLCSRPFKPPVLQCNGAGGHLACGVCVAALPDGLCGTCEDAAGVFGACSSMDTVVSSARVACPHDGCGRFVVYHEAGEHQNACARAPCHCTEPGCGAFEASPAALADHLASVHAVPVRDVVYGKVSRLQVPASVPRLLLVNKDDGRVFLLTVSALGGGGAAAVSVVCVRASAAAKPSFTCKMWVNMKPPPPAANGGKSDLVLVEMQMRSSTSPGAVIAADQPTFLTVPSMYLVPGPGEDGPSMEVALSVRIDKVSPCSC